MSYFHELFKHVSRAQLIFSRDAQGKPMTYMEVYQKGVQFALLLEREYDGNIGLQKDFVVMWTPRDLQALICMVAASLLDVPILLLSKDLVDKKVEDQRTRLVMNQYEGFHQLILCEETGACLDYLESLGLHRNFTCMSYRWAGLPMPGMPRSDKPRYNTFALVFTSGSTTSCKLSCTSHQMFIHEFWEYAKIPGLAELKGTLYHQYNSWYWGASFLGQLSLVLALGLEVWFGSCGSPTSLALKVGQSPKCSLVAVVPSFLETLDPLKDLTTVKVIITWGSVLKTHTRLAWQTEKRAVLDLLFSSEYWLSFYALDVHGFSVLPGVKYSVVPKANLPVGVGELWVSGPQVSLGYYKDPDSTQIQFVNTVHGRYHKSGDLVLQSGTKLYYVGRSNHLVKVNGQWMSLIDEETELQGLPGVRDALVLAAPKPVSYPRENGYSWFISPQVARLNQSGVIHKFVVLSDNHKDKAAEVLAALRYRASTDSRYHFVQEIPKLAVSEKADRRVMAKYIETAGFPGEAPTIDWKTYRGRRHKLLVKSLGSLLSLFLFVGLASWILFGITGELLFFMGLQSLCLPIVYLGVLFLQDNEVTWYFSEKFVVIHQFPFRNMGFAFTLQYVGNALILTRASGRFWPSLTAVGELIYKLILGLDGQVPSLSGEAVDNSVGISLIFWQTWVCVYVTFLAFAIWMGLRSKAWPAWHLTYYLNISNDFARETEWWLPYLWECVFKILANLRNGFHLAFKQSKLGLTILDRALFNRRRPVVRGDEQSNRKFYRNDSNYTSQFATPGETRVYHSQDIYAKPAYERLSSQDYEERDKLWYEGAALADIYFQEDDPVILKHLEEEDQEDFQLKSRPGVIFPAYFIGLFQGVLEPKAIRPEMSLSFLQSMSILTLISRLRKAKDISLNVTQVQGCKTFLQLFELIEDHPRQIVNVSQTDLDYPKDSHEYRNFFSPGQWHSPTRWVFETTGKIDYNTIQTGLEALIIRHPSLRMQVPPGFLPRQSFCYQTSTFFSYLNLWLYVCQSQVEHSRRFETLKPLVLKILEFLNWCLNLVGTAIFMSFPKLIIPKVFGVEGHQLYGEPWLTTKNINYEYQVANEYRSMGREFFPPFKARVLYSPTKTYVVMFLSHAIADGQSFLGLYQDFVALINGVSRFSREKPLLSPANSPESTWNPRWNAHSYANVLEASGLKAAPRNPFPLRENRLEQSLTTNPHRPPEEISFRGQLFTRPQMTQSYSHCLRICDSGSFLVKRVCKKLGYGEDSLLLALCVAALARVSKMDTVCTTLYTPLRDGHNLDECVGLLSDWRDTIFNTSHCLSTLGLIESVMQTTKKREWVPYDQVTEQDFILINVLPFDKTPLGGWEQTNVDKLPYYDNSGSYSAYTYDSPGVRFPNDRPDFPHWTNERKKWGCRPLAVTIEEMDHWYVCLNVDPNRFSYDWARKYGYTFHWMLRELAQLC